MADSPDITFSKEQKVGFVFLLVFGILAVGMGFLQMRNNIYGPFVVSAPEDPVRSQVNSINEAVRLQGLDTDRDGLSDAEELNLLTSPYIPDTDSDGLSDGDEVNGGTDPLCPEGTNCSGLLETDTNLEGAAPVISPLADSSVTPDVLIDASLTGAVDPTGIGQTGAVDVNAVLSDPAQIRQMLINTGQITPEQLANISDERLLELVGQVREDQQGGGGTTLGTPPAQ